MSKALTPPAWTEQALCAQVDSEIFFPRKGGTTEPAKRVCRNCPVSAECLQYALDHDIQVGIWGAMSVEDRRKLKRAAA